MQPVGDGHSFVISGHWNTRIFTPGWVRQNLCEDPQSEVTLAISIDDPTAPQRLSFEGIHLFPHQARLDFKPEEPTLEVMIKCQRIARRALTLLSHTPVTGFGINFSFKETQEPERVTNRFIHRDAESIDSNMYQLTSTVIQRSFRIQQDAKLNLSVSYDANEVRLDFNYHTDAGNAVAAAEALVNDIVSRRHAATLNFIQNVYQFEMDQPQNDQNQAANH